ncbi:hypothetical protein DH2020_008444 [Rehmannia glutinosa]|uniref:Uncharacterized protein n=1 Tax=Rehmannia glutinosa TaxID=99300 RepID=A0ABR0U1W2_REHGL
MEEGVLPLSTILGTPSDTFMDLDYMDELLLEGCWLEANGSEFSQFDPSTPISPFEPSFAWPMLEPGNGESNGSPSNGQDERQRSEGKRVLTTNNQPFSLDLNCPRLAHYREISVNYQFLADEDSKEVVGLPGRVFMNKVPEWTPDVRFFTWDEYRELVTRSSMMFGVLLLFRFLNKAVDLRSSEASTTHNVKTCDLSYQTVLPEILDVLRSACGTHGLPLAQTWVPCILQGDSRIQGFHEACSEYHLLKGQGIVGRAFSTNQPCFSPDVSACCKSEYPLSHHARMFGLKAAVAIRLRSISTGSADFVLEFFLPVNCEDPKEQKKMLTSLSTTIQDVCRTLRVVTDKELKEEENSPVMNIISEEVPNVDRVQFPRAYSSQVNRQESGGAVSPFQNGKPRETLAEFSENRLGQPDSNSKEDITFVTNTSTSGDGSTLYSNRTGEKRRIKAEKTITLEVLRQHFAGSLKDAARNLGVCPTTLKRICRQHGIQRWPSRKIKKVGHSLQKIQRVIDSVQGTSGVLQIESFYSNFPELASPNASRTTQFSNSKSADNLKPLDGHPESSVLRPPAATSVSPSSSCSQSSSSSQCCSSEAQPNSYSLSVVGEQDPTVKEEPDNATIKRTRSDANLHLSTDAPKPIPRSQSHVSLYWPDKPEGKSQERDAPRIKVTYGEDTIRFRMQNNWRYKDLLREISRRFGVDDVSGFHLKYLDDDAEWVLLTCDADLEECIDVCRSSRSQMIKLAFLCDAQSQYGRSFSFRGPFSL